MRKPFNFRISEHGHTWLKEQAAAYDLTPSEVLRACLTVAINDPAALERALESRQEQM